MSEKLTKSLVERTPPRAARFDVFDAELPGFGVRIFPSGTRSYFLF